MKHFKFILMFFLVAIISSCKNDIQTKQTQYFPNQVGDNWTYRLSGSSVGTIHVEIIGQGILPNGDEASLWQYTYNITNQTFIDTTWVSVIDNNVRIYNSPCLTCTETMPIERMNYILPLNTGNSWHTNATYGDTTKVLKQLNIIVPSGKFNDVFQLSKVRGYVTNSWTKDTIYMKEKIGIVEFSQNEFNLGPVIGNGNWELVNYYVQ